jgi:hypothetical protein
MKTATQEIRKLLKEKFKTKFKVRKRGYSCIDINWQNGPTGDEVSSVTAKFKKGHFDGMTDCYEYSNVIQDIPQVEYIFLRREVTQETYEKAFRIAKPFYNCLKFCENLEDILVEKSGYFHNAREYISHLIQKINLENHLSLETFKNIHTKENLCTI